MHNAALLPGRKLGDLLLIRLHEAAEPHDERVDALPAGGIERGRKIPGLAHGSDSYPNLSNTLVVQEPTERQALRSANASSGSRVRNLCNRLPRAETVQAAAVRPFMPSRELSASAAAAAD